MARGFFSMQKEKKYPKMKFFRKKNFKTFGGNKKNAYLCIAFQGKHITIGLWCNGSTTGFGSVCPGSNPGNPTKNKACNFAGLFSYTKTR